MSEIAVSTRYSRALVGAAEDQGALDRVREDVQGLLGLIGESEDLRDFLGDPLIHPDRKQDLVKTLFSGKVADLTLNFLQVLCEKRRAGALADILQGFLDLLDERQGIVTAHVQSATALSDDQQGLLSERLAANSGKQVRLELEVDEGLKAGFVARLGDRVFDGTLEAQLSRLRRRLISG